MILKYCRHVVIHVISLGKLENSGPPSKSTRKQSFLIILQSYLSALLSKFSVSLLLL